jgi:hypothetical protein
VTEGRRVNGTAPFIGAGLASGLVGLGLVFLGSRSEPRQAALSYLAAYAFGASVSLGALALLLIGHVTGARWLVAIRRPVEAVAAILPVYALLFVPIALALPSIYPWVSPGGLEAHAAELIERKRSFLNPTAFLVRAAVYLLVWSVLGVILWRRSVRHDASPGPVADSEPRGLSAVALPLFAFTFTFAAFDWLMSLEPTWFSTVYGAYCFADAFRSALALAIIVAALWKSRGLLPAEVGPSHFHALGRLLLTFVIFWAYMAFSQGLIIWIGDIPLESAWYVTRTRGAWSYVFVFLGVGGFAAPFFVLLSRDLKRRPGALAVVAAWLLLVHYVDVYWLVLPALHPEGPRPHWLDAAALVGVGGIALAATASLLRGVAPVPRGAPGLAASLRYTSV